MTVWKLLIERDLFFEINNIYEIPVINLMRTVQDLWGEKLETLLCQFSDQRRLEWVERQHIPGYCKDINPWKISYKFKVILLSKHQRKLELDPKRLIYEHGCLGMKDCKKKKKKHMASVHYC